MFFEIINILKEELDVRTTNSLNGCLCVLFYFLAFSVSENYYERSICPFEASICVLRFSFHWRFRRLLFLSDGSLLSAQILDNPRLRAILFTTRDRNVVVFSTKFLFCGFTFLSVVPSSFSMVSLILPAARFFSRDLFPFNVRFRYATCEKIFLPARSSFQSKLLWSLCLLSLRPDTVSPTKHSHDSTNKKVPTLKSQFYNRTRFRWSCFNSREKNINLVVTYNQWDFFPSVFLFFFFLSFIEVSILRNDVPHSSQARINFTERHSSTKLLIKHVFDINLIY